MIPRTAKQAAQLANYHQTKSRTHFANGIRGSKKRDFEQDNAGRWIVAGVVFCIILIVFIWSHKP